MYTNQYYKLENALEALMVRKSDLALEIHEMNLTAKEIASREAAIRFLTEKETELKNAIELAFAIASEIDF